MPVMDGVEATRAIRALNDSVCILGMTGDVDEEGKAPFITAGAQQVLTKPVDMKALVATILALSDNH